MAYEDFKDLTRRKAVDNVLRDNAFNIAFNVHLLQWSLNFLMKKLLVVVSKMRIFQTNN